MPAPTRFGRYLLVERLAVGGMAEIFLAKSTGAGGFERYCVIKRVLPHLGRDPEFVRMFLDEARLAARLHHPGIVQIHELGRVDEDYFIAMEYLAGHDLAAVLVQARRVGRKLPLEVAVQIIAAAADALHSAHEYRDPKAGPLHIVHRDVSPSNLFVTFHGGVKVLDFGVARAEGRLATTEAGSTKGKLSYMSPEQALGKPIDRRTDVWALGLCLRELLTGERLFTGGGATLERVRRICEAPIPPPSQRREEVPAALDQITLRALERDLERRYPTAQAFRQELLGLLTARPPVLGTSTPSDALVTLYGEAHVRARSVIATAAEGPPSGTTPLRLTTSGEAATPALPSLEGSAVTPALLPLEAPHARERALRPVDDSGLTPVIPQQAEADPGSPGRRPLDGSEWPPSAPGLDGVHARPPEPAQRLGAAPVTAAPAASAHTSALDASPTPRDPRAWRALGALVLLLGLGVGLSLRLQPWTGANQDVQALSVEAPLAERPSGAAAPQASAPAPKATPPMVVDAPDAHVPLLVADSTDGTPTTSEDSLHTEQAPVATRAPVTAPRKARTTTGLLTVHANVPVEVRLGDRLLGRVPLEEIRLPAGRHVLRLVDAARGLSRTVTVRIARGRTTVHRATLGTGTLNVDAVPWAKVWIDGEERGLTPLAGVVLWEGAHRLRLEGPEATRTQTVRIRPGKVTSVRESLLPPSASR